MCLPGGEDVLVGLYFYGGGILHALFYGFEAFGCCVLVLRCQLIFDSLRDGVL